MFEPLREILPEDPQALVDDARILGEKAGRLYGSRSAAAYAALGGVIYQPLRCTNDSVVQWDSATSSAATAGGSASSSTAAVSQDGSTSGLTSWLAAALAWLGSASGPRRRTFRRSGRSGWGGSSSSSFPADPSHRRIDGLGVVRRCLSAAPHLLPHLVQRLVDGAAFLFPCIRTICPTALPDVSRLLEARQSSSSPRGGPERVTALSFHPLYRWLAVAVDGGAADGAARVLLYDPTTETVTTVLSHAFQKDVHWLQWKPYAAEVLAVGCRGGVLLWSLGISAAATATTTSPSPTAAAASIPALAGTASAESSARAVFYRTSAAFELTSAAFSNRDGSMLACASVADTRLHLLNLRQPPFSAAAKAATVVPSIDGGVGAVLFDDEDAFLLCAVCEHRSLAFVRCSAGLSTLETSTVPVPAPVQGMVRATGLGPSHFFLAMKGLEGVLLARVNPFIGVEVVALISTGLYRGVGGCVTHLTCSRRRLYMQTETNHLVVCRYGQHGGDMTVLPVGVATMEAVAMATFDGCTTGSMVAIVEQDGSVSIIPSYHS